MGVHGEKLLATLANDKLPESDRPRIEAAIVRYHTWVERISAINEQNIEELIRQMVALLNEYKLTVDVDLIFDSPNDFLYRQKGQLKN